MKLGMTPDEVEPEFEGLMQLLASYRDVLPGRQNFDLFVKDCWNGLWKAKSLHWVEFENERFDPFEHDHYGSAMNGGFHVIVPGKFIAMRGPEDLSDDKLWSDVLDSDGRFHYRVFSPKYYTEHLLQRGVQARNARSPLARPAACPRPHARWMPCPALDRVMKAHRPAYPSWHTDPTCHT